MKIAKRKLAIIMSASLVSGIGVVHADQTLRFSVRSVPSMQFEYKVGSSPTYTSVDRDAIEFKKGEDLTFKITVLSGQGYAGKNFDFSLNPYDETDPTKPDNIYNISYKVDNKAGTACKFAGGTTHSCEILYAAKDTKHDTSVTLTDNRGSQINRLAALIEVNKPPVNYGNIKVKVPDISTISAADDPEDDAIDLNTVYEYDPKGFDVTKIDKVEITIHPKSDTIGDVYDDQGKKSYTCTITKFPTPAPAGGYVCDNPLDFWPYRIGETQLETTSKITIKGDPNPHDLPPAAAVIAHVGTLLVGSDHLKDGSASYVIGRNVLHTGAQLATFDLAKSKLMTTDKTGLRYMNADAFSVPNRVSILSSSLIASAPFDTTKDGTAAVTTVDAFTNANNIYNSPGSGNIITSFALAQQDDQKKVSLTFADARGNTIKRVLDYAKTAPKSWKPVALGKLTSILDTASYINIPVEYGPTALNQNFAESLGYYYKFEGTAASTGVKKLTDNPDVDTSSAATRGVALSYKDVLFSVTPDKTGKSQLYYLDDKTTPAKPEWKKTTVGPRLAQYSVRSVAVTFDGTLVMGDGADTKALFCTYSDKAPYYAIAGCTSIPVEGAGGVMRITSDAKNRVYTLAGDGTITRYAKDPGTGKYAKDGSAFTDYQKAFQSQSDKGPGATSMVIIGDVNTDLL